MIFSLKEKERMIGWLICSVISINLSKEIILECRIGLAREYIDPREL
jgi:hypothetical protein